MRTRRRRRRRTNVWVATMLGSVARDCMYLRCSSSLMGGEEAEGAAPVVWPEGGREEEEEGLCLGGGPYSAMRRLRS